MFTLSVNNGFSWSTSHTLSTSLNQVIATEKWSVYWNMAYAQMSYLKGQKKTKTKKKNYNFNTDYLTGGKWSIHGPKQHKGTSCRPSITPILSLVFNVYLWNGCSSKQDHFVSQRVSLRRETSSCMSKYGNGSKATLHTQIFNYNHYNIWKIIHTLNPIPDELWCGTVS